MSVLVRTLAEDDWFTFDLYALALCSTLQYLNHEWPWICCVSIWQWLHLVSLKLVANLAVVLLALIANLATSWRHLHLLHIWPPGGCTNISSNFLATCIATLPWIALLNFISGAHKIFRYWSHSGLKGVKTEEKNWLEQKVKNGKNTSQTAETKLKNDQRNFGGTLRQT